MTDVQAMQQKVESLDRTLFMGLKCMTVLMEDLEIATREDGSVPQHEREVARVRIREMVATMKSMF